MKTLGIGNIKNTRDIKNIRDAINYSPYGNLPKDKDELYIKIYKQLLDKYHKTNINLEDNEIKL